MSDRGVKIDALKTKIAGLQDKLGDQAEQIISDLKSEIDDLNTMVDEEMAELKDVGVKNWIKSNPQKATGIAVITVAIIAGIVYAMQMGGAAV
jgi:hypothetical protein